MPAQRKSRLSGGDLVAIGEQVATRLNISTRPAVFFDGFDGDALDTAIWERKGNVTFGSSLAQIINGELTSYSQRASAYEKFNFGVLIFHAKMVNGASVGFSDGTDYLRLTATQFQSLNSATSSLTKEVTLDPNNYHTYAIFWSPDWCLLEIDNTPSVWITQYIPTKKLPIKLVGGTSSLAVDVVAVYDIGLIPSTLEGQVKISPALKTLKGEYVCYVPG